MIIVLIIGTNGIQWEVIIGQIITVKIYIQGLTKTYLEAMV